MSTDSRRPRSVYSRGTEPDARFSLANERTFLAWVRTALALIAGGLAFEVVVTDHPSVRILAAVLVLAGAVVAAHAWSRWAGAERALRERAPLPAPALGPVLAYTVALGGIAAFVIAVLL